MAREKRSLANRRHSFTPSIVKQACSGWQLADRLVPHQTTTRNWGFQQDVETYQKLGIRAFGAWRYKVEDFGEERAFDLIKEMGMTISSLSWAGGFAYSDRAGYLAAIDDAQEAVLTASRLDAGVLVVLPGTRGSYTLNHGRRMVIDALQRVAHLAAKHDVQIALQPVDPQFADEGNLIDSLDSMVEFLTACAHPNIGLNLDLFHLRHTPRLVDRIPQLLPWIRLVQLSDCHNPRNELDRCALGEGALPVQDTIEALEAIGYQGFYEAQLMSTAVWQSSYQQALVDTRQRLCDWIC